MEYRNAVFVVTSEDSCPIYNVGEEIQVQDSAVSVDYEKPVCLILVRELHKALAKKPGEQRFDFTANLSRSVRFQPGEGI